MFSSFYLYTPISYVMRVMLLLKINIFPTSEFRAFLRLSALEGNFSAFVVCHVIPKTNTCVCLPWLVANHVAYMRCMALLYVVNTHVRSDCICWYDTIYTIALGCLLVQYSFSRRAECVTQNVVVSCSVKHTVSREHLCCVSCPVQLRIAWIISVTPSVSHSPRVKCVLCANVKQQADIFSEKPNSVASIRKGLNRHRTQKGLPQFSTHRRMTNLSSYASTTGKTLHNRTLGL